MEIINQENLHKEETRKNILIKFITHLKKNKGSNRLQ